MEITDLELRIEQRRNDVYNRTHIEDLTTKSVDEIINLMSPAEREYIRRVIDQKMSEVASMHDMYFIMETEPLHPINGTHWYNPVNGITLVWNGTEWGTNSSYLNAVLQKYNYDGEDGKYVYLATYTDERFIEVYRNGFKLPPNDYITSEVHGSQNEVHLKTPTNLTDKVEILSFQPFQVSYVYDDQQLINDVATANAYFADINDIVEHLTPTLLQTIADNETNINIVATDIVKVSNVATDIVKVSNVSDNMVKVSNVSDNMVKVADVSDNMTNVSVTASNMSSVNTIATDLNKEIDDDVESSSDIKRVSDNISDVINASNNMFDINNISTNMGSFVVIANTITTELGTTKFLSGNGSYVDIVDFDFSNLPTTDPLTVGKLWNNSGVLTISAG